VHDTNRYPAEPYYAAAAKAIFFIGGVSLPSADGSTPSFGSALRLTPDRGNGDSTFIACGEPPRDPCEPSGGVRERPLRSLDAREEKELAASA
jgi:hypothetical protein